MGNSKVEREKISVLLVTHDLEEALSLSDEVYLLSPGPRAHITEHYSVPIPRPRASANLLRSKATNADLWVIGLRRRRPSLVVAVALANKTDGGLKRAVAQGVKLGRPKIDSATERKVRRRLAKGMGILKVAKSLGIGTAMWAARQYKSRAVWVS